jgi:hypothetical protein
MNAVLILLYNATGYIVSPYVRLLPHGAGRPIPRRFVPRARGAEAAFAVALVPEVVVVPAADTVALGTVNPVGRVPARAAPKPTPEPAPVPAPARAPTLVPASGPGKPSAFIAASELLLLLVKLMRFVAWVTGVGALASACRCRTDDWRRTTGFAGAEVVFTRDFALENARNPGRPSSTSLSRSRLLPLNAPNAPNPPNPLPKRVLKLCDRSSRSRSCSSALGASHVDRGSAVRRCAAISAAVRFSSRTARPIILAICFRTAASMGGSTEVNSACEGSVGTDRAVVSRPTTDVTYRVLPQRFVCKLAQVACLRLAREHALHSVGERLRVSVEVINLTTYEETLGSCHGDIEQPPLLRHLLLLNTTC